MNQRHFTSTKSNASSGQPLSADPSAPSPADLEQGPSEEPSLQGGWEPLLRTLHWAELGYFESLLHQHMIPTGVFEEDHYDPSGYWRERLTLLVPSDQAEQALALLQQDLHDEETDKSLEGSVDALASSSRSAAGIRGSDRGTAHSGDWEDPWNQPYFGSKLPPAQQFPQGSGFPPDQSGGLSWWKPAVCLLVVGGLGYWGYSAWHRQDPPPPGNVPADLWEALRGLQAPLVEATPPGEPRQRWWVDQRTRTLHLERDRDGDGLFEQQRIVPLQRLR